MVFLAADQGSGVGERDCRHEWGQESMAAQRAGVEPAADGKGASGSETPERTLDLQPVESAMESVEGKLPEQGSQLERRLLELKVLFEEHIAKDRLKGELISRLYEELDRHREDFVFKHVTSRVCHDLIRLFDRVDRLQGELSSGSLTEVDAAAHLRSFRSEILRILKRQGITLLDETPSKFDPEVQEALGCRDVGAPESAQCVLEVVRRGFLYRGKTFRPEGVIVGIYAGSGDRGEER